MKRTSFATQIYSIFILAIALLFQACRPDPIIPDPDPEDEVIELASISGKWIRVESTNPSADHIRIEVVGSTGTITNKALSGFSVGDIKWKDLTPSNETQLTYQELGSDGLYYDATMTVVNDNELSLAVNSSGAGNSQKWIKDDGSIPVEIAATVLDCNAFTSDMVLVNTDAPVDYVVTCVMDVTASLVIEPGVVIEVEENGGLGVYDAGSIKAVGTSANPIVIRGENNAPGYWRGIHIESNTFDNQFDYVTIENAGSNYVYCCNEKASLFLKDGLVSIKHTTIQTGGAFGIYARRDVNIREFENNTITTHQEAPMYIDIMRAGELDGTNSDFTGNDDDHIRIYDSDVTADITMPQNNVPYLIDGKVIDIREHLTLDAGVEMIFKENGGLGVLDDGALTSDGTVSLPVSLRGEEALKGFWRGIHIQTNSSKNAFTYTNISDAGAEYVYCCNTPATIFLKGGRLSISNSILSNGESYGLYADKDAQLSVYSENQITTHKFFPLYMAAERYGEIDGLSSDYSGNDNDFVGVMNSQILNSTTWKATNVPYQVEHVIDVVKPLTIEAGADLTFVEQGGLGVYDDGWLNAEGTAANKIIFRGTENTVGYWRGIHIETNSSSNVFTHTEIRNGGGNYVYCCNEKANILLKGGQATVENSTILDSGGCGIQVKSGGILTEAGNVFAGNVDGNVCQ